MLKALAIPVCAAFFWLAQGLFLSNSILGLESPVAVEEAIQDAEGGAAQGLKLGQNRHGLYELVTPRLTLVSDIPFDDELKSWPSLIEQSLEQWQLYFGVDAKRMAGWHVTAMLIGDRDRLSKLGMLDGVPGFDEGYQFGNKIYLREQPTVYYRRHLFLHEATHWIMWQLYGGGGSPWFMEGMAEMNGTHALQNGVLKLGVIPSSREKVSGWGRLRLIDETLNRGVAPSMSEILAFGNEREDHEIRYSWSWAATLFFTNHPKYGPILKKLYNNKLDYSDSLSLAFKKQLAADWKDVQIDWNGFISDLDFGYDLERSRVVRQMIPASKKNGNGDPESFQIATDRGWQSTGVMVGAGKPVRVACSGAYVLRKSTDRDQQDWVVGPNGITYRFYRGNPLGCVIASVVSVGDMEQTRRWETIRVGGDAIVRSEKPGELFFKVNEPSSGLWDNSGNVSVEISNVKP